jgi:NAD(P)-dependent dehydrogenase (short-subunit alcohol dehydrogenase family)
LTWSSDAIGDLTGRRALVTGVTSGLGEHVALGLLRAGAEVVMAARDERKLEATMADVHSRVPGASLKPLIVDLADLSSVRRAAALASAYGPLDVLVNNAGVMATPYRRTVDGFELQLGTNHLGHFALTGLLLPRLVESGDARVVSVASQMHLFARTAPLGDPRAPGRYQRWQAYARSKLANLLFAFELDRRARAEGLPLRAVAAHPGLASTGLMGAARTLEGSTVRGRILTGAFAVAGQSAEAGAQAILMAATADLPGGAYVGPAGFGGLYGAPHVVEPRPLSRNREVGRRLWEISEEATGVAYP